MSAIMPLAVGDLENQRQAQSIDDQVNLGGQATTSTTDGVLRGPPLTDQANELWPALGDTSDGAATGLTTFQHRARLDGQSVVIHRAGNKVACADLPIEAYPDVETQGVGQLLAAATPDYTALATTAKLTRQLDGMTHVELSATGLMAGVTYPAHVHNLPCALQSGGGHYLRDKAVAAGEANELWLPLTADGAGAVDASVDFDHLAAADARAIVIHDPQSNPANARLTCIDLE